VLEVCEGTNYLATSSKHFVLAPFLVKFE